MSVLTPRNLLFAAALALAAVPAMSEAQTNVNACQAQAANLIDEWLHSPGGGDKDFFTTETSAPPNILFLLDNSGSMNLPIKHPLEGYGCVDEFYLNVPYDPDETYPDFHPVGHPSGDTQYGGFDNLYEKGHVYRLRNAPWEDEHRSNSISDFCDNSTCRDCLENHGFYRSSYGGEYFDGNFLNIVPPRYVMARRAVVEAIHDARDIRMGLALFDWSSGNRNATWIGEGACGSSFNPPCGQAFPTGTSAFDSNRASCIGAVTSLERSDFSTGTPLANALFRLGQYFNYANDVYDAHGFDTKSEFTSATDHQQRSMCWGCQQNAIVVITDGEPWNDNEEVPSAIANLDGDTDPRLDCPECGSGNYLHKVAYWLHHNDQNYFWDDVDNPTFTYTVGFAIDFPLLERTAELGGGSYFRATDADELRDSLGAIVDDMLDRSATFSTTTLSSVQAQAIQSVLIPKFVPDKDGPWPGELFRFDFLSEFAIEMDLDGDDEESSLFLVDSDCTDAEGADLDWAAIRAGDESIPVGCVPVREATEEDIAGNSALEHGRYYKTEDFDDDTLTTTRARPFWEANDVLTDTAEDPKTPLDRNVYTFIDTANDGQLERRPFHPDNISELLPYLGLNAGTFCEEMARRLETPIGEETCGKILVRYVLGCELPSEEDEIDSCTPREQILQDIFHSPPTIVERPTPFGLMTTPFRHDQSPWPLSEDNDFESDTDGNENAYAVFAKEHSERRRVALVGSNGGMLHAFNAGDFLSEESFNVKYDRGSGEELWAVVPTTLLPRLRHMPPQIGETFEHRYYVDGHPWVRNIWVDGLGNESSIDYKRQPEEFRTVAVMSLRQGGNRWFALDVTDIGESDYEPELLWMFPEIGSPLELAVGQSWSDVQPKPPPIGPIRYEDTSSPVSFKGTNFRERWIAAIPGGHDPRHLRGRGWYMLDVYTGEKIWEFYHPDKDESINDDDPRWNLAYSFAAPPTLTAWGDDIAFTWGNRYFDTLIVGDTGGQLWVGRFGHPDPDNWHGARFFEPTINSDTEDENKVAWHPPFYQSAHLTLMPENRYLRAYVGTGDRANLRDPAGGICSPENLGACARSGTCDLDEVHLHNLDFKFSGGPARNHHHYESDHEDERTIKFKDPRMELTPLPSDVCPDIEIGFFEIEIEDCVDYDGDDIADFEIRGEISCEFDTDTGVYDCTGGEGHNRNRWRWGQEEGSLDAIACTDTRNAPPERFYSVRVFGGHEDLQPFNSLTEAIDFDKARLATGDDAEDVRHINPDSDDPPGVTAASAGWYYEYGKVSERTATAGVTAGRCVVWSSLEASETNLACGGEALEEGEDHPLCDPNLKGCPCSEAVADQESFMYFRNYVTGASDCVEYPPGDGWADEDGRISVGQEPQPPPSPQVMTEVSASGQVRTSVVTTDESVGIGESDELMKEFSIIDVPVDLHMWRHMACDPDEDIRCH